VCKEGKIVYIAKLNSHWRHVICAAWKRKGKQLGPPRRSCFAFFSEQCINLMHMIWCVLKWDIWEPNNSQPSVLLKWFYHRTRKTRGCLMQRTCGKLKAVLLSPITAKESLIWLIWHNRKANLFNQTFISYLQVSNIELLPHQYIFLL
jgi:hypothetical protein